MPSSVLVDGERTTAERVVGLQEPLDEHRALQMALEQLSLLGLDEATPGISNGIAGDGPSKRRNNSTECVAVPSSEHVAEIVGRQGERFVCPENNGSSSSSTGRGRSLLLRVYLYYCLYPFGLFGALRTLF